MNREEFRLMKIFYIANFLLGLFTNLLSPFWIIYFLSLDLSLFQISVLLSLISVGRLLFEIPTGTIADYFGRKISVVIAFIILGLTSIGIGLTSSFLTLAILFFIAGVGATFQSGAYSAWVIDYLKHKKKSKMIHSTFSRLFSFDYAGGIIAFLLGGLIAIFSLRIMWFIEGFAQILIALFLLFFAKEYFKKPKIRTSKLREPFRLGKKAIRFGFSHKVLFKLLIITFFTYFVFSFISIGWQPYFKDLGIPVPLLGPILALSSAIGIVGMNLSKRLVKFAKGERNALIILTLGKVLTVFLLGFVFSPLIALLVFYFFMISHDSRQPILTTYFNRFVPSRIRATVGSIDSVVRSISVILGLMTFGFLADVVGIRMLFIISSLILLITIPIYLMIRK